MTAGRGPRNDDVGLAGDLRHTPGNDPGRPRPPIRSILIAATANAVLAGAVSLSGNVLVAIAAGASLAVCSLIMVTAAATQTRG